MRLLVWEMLKCLLHILAAARLGPPVLMSDAEPLLARLSRQSVAVVGRLLVLLPLGLQFLIAGRQKEPSPLPLLVLGVEAVAMPTLVPKSLAKVVAAFVLSILTLITIVSRLDASVRLLADARKRLGRPPVKPRTVVVTPNEAPPYAVSLAALAAVVAAPEAARVASPLAALRDAVAVSPAA